MDGMVVGLIRALLILAVCIFALFSIMVYEIREAFGIGAGFYKVTGLSIFLAEVTFVFFQMLRYKAADIRSSRRNRQRVIDRRIKERVDEYVKEESWISN